MRFRYRYCIIRFIWCQDLITHQDSRHFNIIIIYNIPGWWFGTFFIFPYIGNSNPDWLSYFSVGLKPPIRYTCCSISLFDIIGFHQMSRSWQHHRQGGEASKPMEQQIKQANGGGGLERSPQKVNLIPMNQWFLSLGIPKVNLIPGLVTTS